MAFSINTNVASLQAENYLTETTDFQNQRSTRSHPASVLSTRETMPPVWRSPMAIVPRRPC